MERLKYNFDSYVMPRSGSTLYANVLRKIFVREDGEKLNCIHDPIKGMEKTVALYRDFRDVMVSHWRIRHAKYKNGVVINKIDKKELEAMFKTVFRLIRVLDGFIQRYPESILIKYEDFWDDTGKLIDRISEHLDVEIPEELRKKAISENIIEDAKKISDELGECFDKIDEETDLHGKHIYKGIPGGWKEFIDESLHKKVNTVLGGHLKRYGYIV